MEGIAEYDFEGRAHDELSFQYGDLILITNTCEDDDWYKATVHGKDGYIPKNYIKFLEPNWFWNDITRAQAEHCLSSHQIPTGGFCVRRSESISGAYSLSVKKSKETVQHYKVLRDKDGLYYIWLKKFQSLNVLIDYYKTHSVSTQGNLKLTSQSLQYNIKKCRALFDFKPEEREEIGLRKGDVVVIVDDTDENWWKGINHSRVGLFPSNYVELI